MQIAHCAWRPSLLTQILIVRKDHIFSSDATLAVEDTVWVAFPLDSQKPLIILAPKGFCKFRFIDIGLELSVSCNLGDLKGLTSLR